MIRLYLTDDQRQELQRRLRRHRAAPVPALRLEIVRLAAEGWRVPAIAQPLGRPEQTARQFVQGFKESGCAGLEDRPWPGPHRRLLAPQLKALDDLLDHTGRPWTAPQLAAWLEREQGVRVHPD